MAGVCDVCGGAIVEAVSEHGAPFPVDAERRRDGTIVLAHTGVGEPPIALVQNAGQLELLHAQAARRGELLELFVAHPCAAAAAARAGVASDQLALELDAGARRVTGE